MTVTPAAQDLVFVAGCTLAGAVLGACVAGACELIRR